jgi:hypothetical protein
MVDRSQKSHGVKDYVPLTPKGYRRWSAYLERWCFCCISRSDLFLFPLLTRAPNVLIPVVCGLGREESCVQSCKSQDLERIRSTAAALMYKALSSYRAKLRMPVFIFARRLGYLDQSYLHAASESEVGTFEWVRFGAIDPWMCVTSGGGSTALDGLASSIERSCRRIGGGTNHASVLFCETCSLW